VTYDDNQFLSSEHNGHDYEAGYFGVKADYDGQDSPAEDSSLYGMGDVRF